MVHFGFSYVGLAFIAMLLIPNFIWAKNKPADYDRYVGNENRFLLILERIGEAGNMVLALVFADFNIRPFTLWSLWLVAAALLMVLYELYWIRYFRSGKTMADMYSSFAALHRFLLSGHLRQQHLPDSKHDHTLDRTYRDPLGSP